jgi:hypothetical protein
MDERAALKLRKVLAQSEAERAELWRQVCSKYKHGCHAKPMCLFVHTSRFTYVCVLGGTAYNAHAFSVSLHRAWR